MNNLKRFLALVLVLSMMLTAIPFSVFAADSDVSHMATKPADGTTSGEPFPENTGGSYSFRIPAMVTLGDGTLVAAADARWNTTYDGGGLDTIVARSSNNGATWNYTFANYLGDNGNQYNGSQSTCFIDPSLAVTADDTIYMLCDLYPYGVALNGDGSQTAPSKEVGFTDEGYLKLSGDNHQTYTFYLKNGQIYDYTNNTIGGYTVDDHFNLFYYDQYQTNLFFSDSPYKVVRTGYLYLTKSTNGGATWSAPTLLNLKTSSEQVCLVGPNGGMVTSEGVIVFPVYSYDNGTEHTGLIYSEDDGATWKRSATLTFSDGNNSSEADAVELGNGKLRVFFRNKTSYLCYADYDLGSNSWSNYVNTLVLTNSNTELSAITYSSGVLHNGVDKDVILVSCPASANLAGSSNSDGSWRTSGRIFAGLVDPETCEMTWLDDSVGVTPVATGQLSGSNYTAEQGFFAYSSIAELNDGTVAILYEDNQYGWGAGDDYGYTMAYDTYTETELEAALGVTFIGDVDIDVDGSEGGDIDADVVNVELKVGDTKKYTEASGAYTTATTEPDSNIARMALTTVTGSEETTVSTTKATELEDGATYIIRVFNTTYALSSNAGRGDWGTSTLAFETNTLTVNEDHLWTLEAANGGYKLKNANGYLNLGTGNNSAYLNTTGEVFTITSTATGWTICNQSGEYINALGGLTTYYSAGGWTGNDTKFDLYKVTTATPASTEVSFTGVGVGKTTAVVGNTTYNITVTDPNGVYVELEVGESLTYTDTTGNYVGSGPIVQPDTTYASMTVADGLALKAVTALESGKQYLIVNKVTGQILTDTEMQVTGNYGNKSGLATTGTASADSKELWTITLTAGKYTVVQSGQYLTIAGFYANMSETPTSLTLTYDTANAGWTIADSTTADASTDLGTGTYYLSDNVGDNYVNGALGTNNTANTYLYWDIYEILPLNTQITFTGNAVGETTAVVGSTTYYITVEAYVLDDEIHDTNNGYTVNAELQRSRYNELINGMAKDLYTDESWPAYESARKAAYAKLTDVDGNTYTTEAAAQAALNELIAAIDALEDAKATLVAAKTITVHYQLDGTTVLTEEYKVAANATTLTLPDVLVVGKQTYTISETQNSDDEDEQITITDGVLTLPENDTVVYVAVDKGVVLGNGFVASTDISADGDYVGTGAQIADLVKDDGTRMKITEMTLTTGFSYDLDLADTLANGQTVEWSSDNTDYVTVDQNGNVTAVAAGTANVTAIVKDAAGNVVSVNSIPVTVFTSATTNRVAAVYIENIENTTVYCVVNADTDAKAFQVIEGELIYGKFDTTVSDGTATTAFSFFGDPDEAHALVAMTSTNSFGDYYLLHDDDGNMGVGTQYYRLPDGTNGAGRWQALGLNDNVTENWTIIENMVQWAIDKGCDGGMGFTRRQTEGNIGTNLTFVSDPMPTIEKQVDGVLPTTRKTADYRRYTDGMVAAVNELVYFKITVTLEVPTIWTDANQTVSAITYSNAIVSDTVLKGAYLYTKDLDQADGVYDGEIDAAHRVQAEDITAKLNASWTAEEKAAGKRVLEYYLMYEIQESDIPKFYIDNIANLNYNYKSHYSTGAQAGAADAEARISVVGTAIDDVVIDFGQSVVYTGLENVHLKGVYVDGENDVAGITKSKATAKYGDVKVTRTQRVVNGEEQFDDKGYPVYDYTVTYTPNQILHEIDTVLLYGVGENNQEKIINGFLVYPATTVYYEEGFMVNEDTTWTTGNAKMATTEQTFELLGKSQFDEDGTLTEKISDKKHAYGYDPIYNSDGTDDVEKSSISATNVGASTTFTFTGNGFELFADCTTSTGSVSVQVQNSAGKYVKIFNVNTVVKEGYTKATDGQDVNMDSLPIVSWHSETHDTYKVTIKKVTNDLPVYLDGVRVFNTVDESKYVTEENVSNSPFAIDLEDAPAFYQLRDYVLYALEVDNSTSVDYKTMYEQVYELLGDAQSAVILSAENPYETTSALGTTVYLRTTTKTTVTTTTYTDDTSVVVTRADVNVEEYSDAARTILTRTRSNTDATSVYYNAKGEVVDLNGFGDVKTKTISSETTGEPKEETVDTEMNVMTAQDLLDNGPKNELYLHKGESLVFQVKTSRAMQIGLKAPVGNTSYTISGAGEPLTGDMKTTVDMFYELGNTTGTETEYTITVTNTGSNILAVTDLKICDDPNAAFVALTEEDIETALIAMGYGDPCEAGHSYESVVTAPTCTEAGYTTYTCTACGDSYVGDETAALGHSHEAVVTAPTCTEAGYTTYTCTICGDSYVGGETAALGHSYEAVVTEPTCTEQGYTTYTCHCGDTYVGDYVAATGHHYSNGSCTDCGAEDPNYSGSSSSTGGVISKLIGWLIGLIRP